MSLKLEIIIRIIENENDGFLKEYPIILDNFLLILIISELPHLGEAEDNI